MLPVNPSLIIALGFLFQRVRGDSISTNIPLTIPQCKPVTVSWSGGTPPYYIFFNSTANVRSEAPEDNGHNITIIVGLGFGNIYDTSYTTPINFQAFLPASFQVTDSKNVTSPIAPFEVTAGDSSDCVVKFTNGFDQIFHGEGIAFTHPIGQIHSCNSESVEWVNGVPPYTLAVRTVGLSILQEQIFAGFDSSSPSVQIAFPPGAQVVLEVEDNAGQTDKTGPFTLQDNFSNCMINNITAINSSIPSPTAELPFPTFFSHVPKPSHHKSGPYTGSDSSLSDGISTGAIIGIIISVPLGVGFILSLLGLFLASRVLSRRRRMLQPYWLSRSKQEYRALGSTPM